MPMLLHLTLTTLTRLQSMPNSKLTATYSPSATRKLKAMKATSSVRLEAHLITCSARRSLLAVPTTCSRGGNRPDQIIRSLFRANIPSKSSTTITRCSRHRHRNRKSTWLSRASTQSSRKTLIQRNSRKKLSKATRQ